MEKENKDMIEAKASEVAKLLEGMSYKDAFEVIKSAKWILQENSTIQIKVPNQV